MADTRSRNWGAILYPDSLPDNWQTLIADMHIKCAVSPLHDKDTKEDSNELKKAHYHLIMCFDGKKSFTQVQTLLAPLNCTIPQVVHDVRGNTRYLIHADNSDKAQYQRSDILTFSGFDVDKHFLVSSVSEIHNIRSDLLALIQQADITEFCDLIDVLADNDMIDMLDYVTNYKNSWVQSYVNSRRFRRSKTYKTDSTNNCTDKE